MISESTKDFIDEVKGLLNSGNNSPGGSGADEVARAAIEAHAGNSSLHLTAEQLNSAVDEVKTYADEKDAETLAAAKTYADAAVSEHNSSENAHADIINSIYEKISNLLSKRIIATRERDSSKPDYGIGGSDEISAVLEIGTYTGTAATTVVISGVEYDALNLSHSGESVPDGNIIFNTEV